MSKEVTDHILPVDGGKTRFTVYPEEALVV